MLTQTRGSVPARAALLAVVGTVAAVQSASAQSWNKDADGAWTDQNNWLPAAVPNAANASAVFGNVITAARTVSINPSVTVGSLSLSTQANQASYTITSGVGKLLTFGGNNNTITVAANNANAHSIAADLLVTNSDRPSTTRASNTFTSGGTGSRTTSRGS